MSKKPDAPPAEPKVMGNRILGGAKNNIWRCKIVDSGGNPVQPAPGMTYLEIRGPGTKADAIEAIRLLLDSKRVDAMRVGEDDPGYQMAEGSLEPLGHTEITTADFGRFRPNGAAPLDLPTDAAVRAAHEKLIADKLGTSDNA